MKHFQKIDFQLTTMGNLPSLAPDEQRGFEFYT
jgi:hypothetical protein